MAYFDYLYQGPLMLMYRTENWSSFNYVISIPKSLTMKSEEAFQYGLANFLNYFVDSDQDSFFDEMLNFYISVSGKECKSFSKSELIEYFTLEEKGGVIAPRLYDGNVVAYDCFPSDLGVASRYAVIENKSNYSIFFETF